MKNKLFLVAMAACVLALGLVLAAGDDNGGGSDKKLNENIKKK
jgi:hypothetical protein